MRRMSRMERMMQYMIKALKLKLPQTEEREWDVPVEDPPRHSIRRTRRSKNRGSSSIERAENNSDSRELTVIYYVIIDNLDN